MKTESWDNIMVKRLNSKGKYNLYYPESQYIADLVKRNQHPKEWLSNPLKHSIRYMLKELFSNGDDFTSHLFIQNITEYIMRKRNNTTLFIPSLKFPQTLYNSTFDIDPNSFSVPFGGYTYFAFRNGTIVNNVKLRGCGFAVIEFKKYISYVRDFISEYQNKHIDPVVAEKFKDSKLIVFLTMSDDGRTLSSRLTPSDLTEWLSVGFTTEDSISDYMTTKLSEIESNLIHVHSRLCGAICCYISAFPDSVKSGVPHDYKNVLSNYEPNQYTRTLNCGGNKIMHFRQGHFATLRHERYRRGKDGNPRIIFKTSCVVGANIKPHTLNKAD